MKNKFILSSLCIAVASFILMTGCSDSADNGNEGAVVEDNSTSANNGTKTDSEDIMVEGDDYVYALMNIPYADFFDAELDNNDIEVSAVSSATPSKWTRRVGTYNVPNTDDEGGVIPGNQFPVKMTQSEFENLQNTVTEENADYYVTLLEEEPNAYKEISIETDGSYSFGEVIGAKLETSEDITFELSTNSNYGDYELEIGGLPEMPIVSAVEIVDKDGKSYGLRDLENIWGSSGHEISWSSGIKLVESHGNALVYDHYESLVGNTLTSIKYFTPEGTFEFPVDVYLPLRFTDELFSIGTYNEETRRYTEKVSTGNAQIMFAEGVSFPEDYEKTMTIVYSTDDSDATALFTIGENYSALAWYNDIAPGRYNVTISDMSGIYAEYREYLYIMADSPAIVPNGNLGVVKAEGISDEEFASYISGITSYYVQEVGSEDMMRFRPSTGSVLNADGSIDYALKIEDDGSEISVFEQEKTYEISINHNGYDRFTFEVTYN